MSVASAGSGSRVLTTVTAVGATGDGFLATVDALPAAAVAPMPGWITGQPLEEQGVETTMPNLPDMVLPATDAVPFEVRVRAVADDVVRLVVAPPGSPPLEDDGTWLGIVVDPSAGHGAGAGADVRVGQDAAVLDTGRVRVRLARAPFSVQVADSVTGEVLLRTAERVRQVAGFPLAPAVLVEDGTTTLHLELAPHEVVTGFGEQFGPLVKNGQRLRLRVEDALGTGTGLAYKPVPVWHSSRGWTGFLNTGAVVTADVGSLRPSVLGLAVADEAVDLYVIAGASVKERLSTYTALTGRASVPPLWAFGLWMGRCRYHSAAEMLAVADGMHDHGIPCDVLHCDPDWLVVDRLSCDFVWNEERFGPRERLVADLAERGQRLSLWELPYLDPRSPRHDEARDRGYLAVDAAGEVVHVEHTPTPDGRPRAMLDVFNPEALAWWQELHEPFLDDGVAVFKTDFGEALPDTCVPVDGTPSAHAHNLYPLRYNGAVSEVLRRREEHALVWGRAGWAGSQRYPGQWGGDAESTVAGMQSTLRGGLSYALSAPGLWSHDIGGFFGPELTPELYVRWTQMGALSPLMRAHGLRPREPWAFGEQALGTAREWIRLRYSLLPHLWQAAHEAQRHGWPVLRPLGLEHPDDPAARGADDTFMVGADLLVVPVFDDGPGPVRRSFHLPAGRWTDLLTGEVLHGPGHRTVDVPLARIPVLVRDGAVVPRVGTDDVGGTDDVLGRPWTLHAYGDADGPRTFVGFDRRPFEVVVTGDRARVCGDQAVEEVVVRHG